MKKQLIYFLLALTAVCLGACNNDDEIDTAHSIFSTEPVERNAFDDWLLDNYTYPYNIDFMYRMKDIESHQARLDGRLCRTGWNRFSPRIRA